MMTADNIGLEMHRLITELYPICRSITGNGFRETLQAVRRYIPLEIHEVPTGTQVFDWTVPREWNIRDAYIKNSRGERVVDFQKSNLHVLNYSTPIQAKLSLAELKPHLFSLPEHPDWIPYRTSYYAERWGFCLTHNQLLALKDDVYEVCIDSTLQDGHLTYGEFLLRGQSPDEILISCHACHPSLANDNLSGLALTTFLARHLSRSKPRYSYRFLFIPGTIGSITWLARNESQVAHIKHGLVISCVGDAGRLMYKKSRRGDAEIDRAAAHVLKHSGQEHGILEFTPYGYDERQYCSPGFNLPIGCFMRTPNGHYPEYHTSADNLDFVKPAGLTDSFEKCLAVLAVLEGNRTYLNLNPKCEPQLGKRGLYQTIGGQTDARQFELAMLWVLNLSDGDHSLLDITERSGTEFGIVRKAAEALVQHSLLKQVA
jgi:aminopeptidase-like protein